MINAKISCLLVGFIGGMLWNSCTPRTDKDISLSVYFPFYKELALQGHKVWLCDQKTGEILDSVSISAGGEARFYSPKFSLPRQVAVRYESVKTDTLNPIRLVGFRNTVVPNSIFSFFYFGDVSTTILCEHPDFLSDKSVSGFLGSPQNIPYFKSILLKYDSIHATASDAMQYNLKTIRENQNSVYLLEHIFSNRDYFDSLELATMLSAFTKDLQKTEVATKIRTLSLNRKSFDKAYPIFDLSDKNGTTKPVFSGEKPYELLVFWASWCYPCRKEIPSLKVLLTQKKEILEIASVSIDEQTSSWTEALLKEQMPWNQFIAGSRKLDVDAQYAIHAIPAMYLFKDRVLVRKFVGFDSLHTYLLAELVK